MAVRRLLLSALAAGALGLVAAPAQAGHPRPPAHVRCVPVEAAGVGQDLGGGRTTATISVAGVRVGTTAATFTVTGTDGTLVSFVGPIVFTGLGGTLTADVTGTLDAATGAFSSTSTALAGTGTLARVTGRLTFTGTEDLATGAFDETVTGELCAPGR